MTIADELALTQGCYFSEDEADKVIRFATKYVCPAYIKAGEFQLLPWQESWLRNLYGWRTKENKKRFRRAILTCGKKCGKTLLVSIVCLYELFAADTPSPWVVTGSTSRENANQVLKELCASIRRNPQLSKLSKITESTKRIKVASRNAVFQALSADATVAEGYNISCAVIDEGAWHRSDKLYRSLEYSTIARPDAPLVMISTASDDTTGWFYGCYTKAKRILSGEDLDTTTLATIYEIPEGMDIEDPANWHLAVPSIGTSFTVEQFRQDLQAAKGNTADWLNFQRRRLNKWVSGGDEVYLDILKWDQLKVPQPPLTGVNFLGVDLSQTTDPSSISLVSCLPDKKFFVKSWAFVAEQGVRKREKHNLTLYRTFIERGEMVMTSGDMIDTSKVKAKIIELAKQYSVKSITFDQASAFVLANEVGQEGFTVFRSPMTFRYMSDPMKEFNRAVSEGRIQHDGNSWLRWCFDNVRTETDSYGSTRCHRERSKDHIDGAVAVFLAYGQALQQQVEGAVRKSVYDDHELFMV